MGRLEIARLFLDGFWWWGCYVPFPFCEEILADWMSVTGDGSQEGREDRELDFNAGFGARFYFGASGGGKK